MRLSIDSLHPLLPIRRARCAAILPGAQLVDLLIHCGTGDTFAFSRLHQLVTPRLRRYAMRLTSEHDMVDDIVQESLIAIWRQAATYDPRCAGAMTWMSAIVRHKTFDHFRAQRVRTDADHGFFADALHEEATACSPCSMIEVRQRAAEIARCMQQLLDAQRHAIELAYMHDLTHEEVAKEMQKPLGTVKTWIRRGVIDLRRQMSDSMRWQGVQRMPARPGLNAA